MKNKIVLQAVVLILSINPLFAQKKQCNRCNHHSEKFKDTLNFCNGSASKSFAYLEKNCFEIGASEDDIVELLGPNFLRKQKTHRRTNEMDLISFDRIKADYDYYIPYTIHMYCDEDKHLMFFPSDCIWLFFKDKILVGKIYKSYG